MKDKSFASVPWGWKPQGKLSSCTSVLLFAAFLFVIAAPVLAEEFRDDFVAAPGAKALHHAYVGGLLEHTVEVVELCEKTAEVFPELDRDLLVAAAIVHEPEILLFDEPTAELDPHAAALVRNYASSISHSGRSVVWTTNVLSEVEGMCSRMLILASGRIVADDNPQRFTRGIAGSGYVDITVSGIRAENIADVLEAMNVSWRTTGENEIRMTAENVSEILDRIVTSIGRMGGSILSIEGKNPKLEDAYLQVLGEVRK